jgi:hypothetical protein
MMATEIAGKPQIVVYFHPYRADNVNMDIQAASMNMSQAGMREEAAVRVEAMGLSAMKEQAAALAKLLESTQAVTDPGLGQKIDVTA